jgi:hypothetical protein
MIVIPIDHSNDILVPSTKGTNSKVIWLLNQKPGTDMWQWRINKQVNASVSTLNASPTIKG